MGKKTKQTKKKPNPPLSQITGTEELSNTIFFFINCFGSHNIVDLVLELPVDQELSVGAGTRCRDGGRSLVN